ncbi:MAG: hypothetical protein AABY10_01880 [Nanoarchaeota archaeon]
MELTQKEVKFLTMMDETRLSNKKMFKRDSEGFRKLFSFTDKEMNVAVKKLVKKGFLSEMDLGSNEVVYFHTDKVSKGILDTKLSSARH